MSKDDETQLKTDQKIQLKTEKKTEFQSWLALQQLSFEARSEEPRDLSFVERMPSKQGGTLVVIQHPQDTPLARHGRDRNGAMAAAPPPPAEPKIAQLTKGLSQARTASNGRRGYVNFLSQ